MNRKTGDLTSSQGRARPPALPDAVLESEAAWAGASTRQAANITQRLGKPALLPIDVSASLLVSCIFAVKAVFNVVITFLIGNTSVWGPWLPARRGRAL